jgi:mono/diheme cytochrome c family protein
MACAQSPVEKLFAERCLPCHGGASTLSGFSVASRESLLRGGKQGAALVLGKPEDSRLYQFLSAGKMPPGKKLAPQEISLIAGWIRQGAPFDRARKEQWWALRTPVNSKPSLAGFENPIDAFVAAKLRENGLDFNPRADQRTLIRRLSFDLIGLPPTPEQISEPFEKAVDRLLASPQYGERWGRHWLDVVRFGETDGGEHNIERKNAWPYRDYVIDAFNRDKPYNQFVREQIAGDLIAKDDPNMAAATGFLVSGPWDSVSAKTNKDATMRMIQRTDELDDMVTTTAATFLGLTVNCARCHDHKFDPIPTRDYYRMAAAFNTAGFGDRDVSTSAQRAERERLAAPIRKELEPVRRGLADLEDPVRARLMHAKLEAFDRETSKAIRRLPLNPIYNRNSFAAVAPSDCVMTFTDQAGSGKARIDKLELLPSGETFGPWEGAAKASLDSPQAMAFTARAPFDTIRWSSDRATGATTGSPLVYKLVCGGKQIASSLDHIGRNEAAMPEVSDAELDALLPSRAALVAKRDAIQARLNAIPPLPAVHAATPLAPSKSYLLERGSVLKPAAEVTPGALSAVTQLSPDLENRAALADWIANPANPLTARVIVNRIWYYHFGTGIVNTPSDFGFNGDRPSHPELLDFLATSFMEHGWSIKWLQRLILSSRTYQQSSAMNTKAHEIDAGNRLYWRMPLKRMGAETTRDTLLAVTGNLDLAMGGPPFKLQQKEKTNYIYRTLDNDGPEVWRRAVYRFVVRGGERTLLDSFDCPDPSVATPQRSISNTPVQALTLFNNSFVLRQADLLAKRVSKDDASVPAQVESAYLVLLGRKPSDKERRLAEAFLATQPLSAYMRVLLNTNEFAYVP